VRPAETYPVAFPAAAFRALAGATELAIADAHGGGRTRPERVTALIAAVYETIAGEDSTPAMARRLAAGSREWLLQRAAMRFAPGADWFAAPCSECGTPYDLSLSMAAAARQEAGRGFPVAEVETSLGRRRFEAPNGGHEERFAQFGGGDPRRTFAALCGLSDDAEPEAQRFTQDDLDAIDAALESISPDVADSAASVCPNCGAETTARLEPMALGFPRLGDVLRDVHVIAGAYGWSEERILALPSPHRATYAAMIRRDRTGRGRREWRQ
jgi:hypothetical protein